jgi:hypothetical protein
MGDANGLAAMNPALRRQCGVIQQLLVKAAVDEIETRYKIGAIVRDVEDAEGTYGKRATEQLAAVLGCGAATLYRYAAVAKMWSEAELPDAHGGRLTWSHLVELTRIPKAWQAWLDRTLEEGWSARNLAREIDADQAEPPPAEDTTRAALLEALKEAQHWNAQVKAFGAALDRLARSPQHPPEIEALLARALDLFGDAHRRTGGA